MRPLRSSGVKLTFAENLEWLGTETFSELVRAGLAYLSARKATKITIIYTTIINHLKALWRAFIVFEAKNSHWQIFEKKKL